MPECLACEKQFNEEDSSAQVSGTYCSLECELVFTEALKESANDSRVRGLIDQDGNSILGGAYQQAVERSIRAAAGSIGIKLPTKE